MSRKSKASLLFFKGDQEISIPIDRKSFIIGRSHKADIRFKDDKRTSRLHCRIFKQDGKYFIEDLGSANSTLVNKVKIQQIQQLFNNDIIKVGHRKIVFRLYQKSASSHAGKVKCSSCGGFIGNDEIERGFASAKQNGYQCSECTNEDLRNGTIFHNYKILEKIAQGGMGIVYKAQHCVLETMAALKIIRRSGRRPDESVRRFLREVKLGSRVVHPNIVRFFDAGEEAGIYYLIMEYCSGQPLSDMLEKEQRLESLLPRIANQIFDALKTIHEADLIHRDIKPANILLLDNGDIKLIDFGLAKSMSAEGVQVITRTGVGVGTLSYVSPEQYAGKKDVDNRTDIYSLAATFYHMICGKPPIQGNNDIEIYNSMADFNIQHPCVLNRNITISVSDCLMKALEKKPENRFADIIEFQKAYEQAVKE